MADKQHKPTLKASGDQVVAPSEVQFRRPFERLSNVDEAKMIQVIEVKSVVGEGDSKGTPIRQITEYFSLEGGLLARVDKMLQGEFEKGIWTK